MYVKFNPSDAVAKARMSPHCAETISDRIHRGGLRCPRCDASEMHPTEKVLLIRAYKIDTSSECLVCASADETSVGGYDKNLVWDHSRDFERGFQNDLAWFR